MRAGQMTSNLARARVKKSRGSWRIGRLVLVSLAAVGALSVGLGAGAASALCHTTCPGDNPPPPPPDVTAVYTLSPGYGWSGDALHISGYDLLNASVTVRGSDPSVTFDAPVTITSDTARDLWFNLPTIHSTVVGPVSLYFHVQTPKGSVDTAGTNMSFTLSPALGADGSGTWYDGNNGQIGQGTAHFDVNRATGSVSGSYWLENDQEPLPFAVDVSAVWVNAQNQVIGYTDPVTETVVGILIFSSPDQTGSFPATTIGPNPGAAPYIHSARVVMVQNHNAELQAILSVAFSGAQNIDFVIGKICALPGACK
jgi:hypothetical protein